MELSALFRVWHAVGILYDSVDAPVGASEDPDRRRQPAVGLAGLAGPTKHDQDGASEARVLFVRPSRPRPRKGRARRGACTGIERACLSMGPVEGERANGLRLF